VVKMATGSGKTKVLSLVLAWSFYHKLYEPESELARNFLVSTPNIIVMDRVYSGEDIPPSLDDEDLRDYFLGKRPPGATTDSKVDLGMILRDIEELMVLNDEAHHIHDPCMAWFKAIEDIHNRLKQKGDSFHAGGHDGHA